MAKDKTVYRVQLDPEGPRWTLSKDGEKVDQFDMKMIAIVRGREMAKPGSTATDGGWLRFGGS